MSVNGVKIRTYETSDRALVRHIACETALRGEPVDALFGDREVVADLLTRYYTDFEPRFVWMAEHQGRVVGYLTGCLDTRRYRRVMARRVVPAVLLRALVCGALRRPETWQWLRAGVETLRMGGLWRKIPIDRFPAHLHVNLLRGFRERGAGRRLVECFIERAHISGAAGVHARVRADNRPAPRFFEDLGFVEVSRYAWALPQGQTLRRCATIVYGRFVRTSPSLPA